MLFRVCDHYEYEYDYNKINKINKINKNNIVQKNECFICLEINQFNELEPVTLKSQKIYVSLCNCNSYAHNGCLRIWYDKKRNCPICRIGVQENINVRRTLYIKFLNYVLYIYLVFKIIVKVIFNFFSILMFTYILVEYYTLLQICYSSNKYNLYNYNNTIEN